MGSIGILTYIFEAAIVLYSLRRPRDLGLKREKIPEAGPRLQMDCANCNAQNPEGAKYCSNCGIRLDLSSGPLKDTVEASVRQEVDHAFQQYTKEQKIVEFDVTEKVTNRLLWREPGSWTGLKYRATAETCYQQKLNQHRSSTNTAKCFYLIMRLLTKQHHRARRALTVSGQYS